MTLQLHHHDSIKKSHDLPTHLPVPQLVESETFLDLGDWHGLGKILLISKHQQNGVSQLILLQLTSDETERQNQHNASKIYFPDNMNIFSGLLEFVLVRFHCNWNINTQKET